MSNAPSPGSMRLEPTGPKRIEPATTKVCPRCNKCLDVAAFGIRRSGGQVYLVSCCRVCSNKRTNAYRDKNPAARLLWSCRHRATQLGLPCDLMEEDIIIPTHCPVLGIELNHRTARRDAPRAANSPSVDRRIPALGYVVGNIQVISWRANRLKSDASLADTEALAAYMRGVPLH